MELNRRFKKLLWLLFLAAVAVGMILANVSHRNSFIQEVEVEVDYSGNDTLVTADQLRAAVFEKFRDMRNKRVKEVDVDGIRKVISKNQFVDNVGVSVTIGSNVHVEVLQRTPLVRVFTKNMQFYLDTKGRYMPISSVNNQRVIVANGYIKKDFSCKVDELDIGELADASNGRHHDIVDVYKVASFIASDKKSVTLFDQIYMNTDGEIEIIPKLGGYTVLLGAAENMEEKFENLYALYEKGFSNIGWNNYSKINLKYENQIICTKK